MAKFEIFSLLKEYEKVLWLDSDMCVQGDISPLFDYSHMAWRPAWTPFYRSITRKGIEKFNILPTDKGPNGGLIFATRDIENYEELTKECYSISNDDSLLNLDAGNCDENTFALIQKKYSIPVTNLDFIYNAPLLSGSVRNAIIIHAIGENKFWNHALLYSLYPQWGKYYDRWEEVGGTPFSGKLAHTGTFGKTKASLLKGVLKMHDSIMNDQYWKAIIRSLKLNTIFCIDDNTYRNWVSIYIGKINKRVHYELYKKNNDCFICLHIEDQTIKNSRGIERRLKRICESHKFLFAKTNSMIGLEQKLNLKGDVNKQVKSFIRKTITVTLLANYLTIKNFLIKKLKNKK